MSVTPTDKDRGLNRLLRMPSFGVRMMLPALLLLAALSIFPFLFIVWMSFNEVSPIGGLSFQWAGLENWVNLFADPAVRSSWVLSAIYFVATVGLEMFLGMAVALLIHEIVWGKNLALSLFLMPIFIAPVMVGLLGRFLVDPTYGLYAWVLNATGIFTKNILGSGESALVAVILMDVWEWTPLVTIIVLAGLSSMPDEVIQAARVDGASYWQRLRYLQFVLERPMKGYYKGQPRGVFELEDRFSKEANNDTFSK